MTGSGSSAGSACDDDTGRVYCTGCLAPAKVLVMTRCVHVDPDVAARIEALAVARGEDPGDVVVQALTEFMEAHND